MRGPSCPHSPTHYPHSPASCPHSPASFPTAPPPASQPHPLSPQPRLLPHSPQELYKHLSLLDPGFTVWVAELPSGSQVQPRRRSLDLTHIRENTLLAEEQSSDSSLVPHFQIHAFHVPQLDYASIS